MLCEISVCPTTADTSEEQCCPTHVPEAAPVLSIAYVCHEVIQLPRTGKLSKQWFPPVQPKTPI